MAPEQLAAIVCGPSTGAVAALANYDVQAAFKVQLEGEMTYSASKLLECLWAVVAVRRPWLCSAPLVTLRSFQRGKLASRAAHHVGSFQRAAFPSQLIMLRSVRGLIVASPSLMSPS